MSAFIFLYFVFYTSQSYDIRLLVIPIQEKRKQGYISEIQLVEFVGMNV